MQWLHPLNKHGAQTTSSEPVLGPGDEVEITVYGAPDLSGRTRVGANGSISMPLVGYVHVAGLSSSEAEEAHCDSTTPEQRR